MIKDGDSSLGMIDSAAGGVSSQGKQGGSGTSSRVPKPIGLHALTNGPYYGGGVQDKKEIESYRGIHSSNTSYGNIDNSQY